MIRLRAVLLAATTLAGSLMLASCGSSDTVDNSTCPASAGATSYYTEPTTNDDSNIVGQRIPQMPHTHVPEGTKVTYNHTPATSGCHYSVAGRAPIQPGVYTQTVDQEYFVHNLEHGYMVVLYNCGSQGPAGCPTDVATLRTWYANQTVDPGLLQCQQQGTIQTAPYTKVLVLPYATDFGHKFAAISWDYYLPLDSADTAQLDKFYANHVGHSVEGICIG
jgi:hypothetical protein